MRLPTIARCLLPFLGLTMATQVHARCGVPDEVRGDPDAAAQFLLEHLDHIGFAEVHVPLESSTEKLKTEVLRPILALKGSDGEFLRLRSPYNEDGTVYIVSSASPSLEADKGDIVFYTLVDTKKGPGVSECTRSMELSPHYDLILRKLAELAR